MPAEKNLRLVEVSADPPWDLADHLLLFSSFWTRNQHSCRLDHERCREFLCGHCGKFTADTFSQIIMDPRCCVVELKTNLTVGKAGVTQTFVVFGDQRRVQTLIKHTRSCIASITEVHNDGLCVISSSPVLHLIIGTSSSPSSLLPTALDTFTEGRFIGRGSVQVVRHYY
jgi:hypothetical protein